MGFDKLWLQHEQPSQETEWNHNDHSQFIVEQKKKKKTGLCKREAQPNLSVDNKSY